MALEFKIPDQQEIEVDFFGHEFVLLVCTKPRQEAIDRLLEEVEKLDSREETLAKMREMVDVVLAPAAGKRKKASTVLTEVWDGGKLTWSQLEGATGELISAAQNPPT